MVNGERWRERDRERGIQKMKRDRKKCKAKLRRARCGKRENDRRGKRMTEVRELKTKVLREERER